MINVAICDDSTAITTELEAMLCRIASALQAEIDCEVFFDGATLLERIRSGVYYDLLYLDIAMDGVNGIDVASVIRSWELPALIVYVSAHEKYLKELFPTEPFRFLSKPVDEAEFRDVFCAAVKRLGRKPEYFHYTYNKSLRRLPLDNIQYFESRNRVIHIHYTSTANAEHKSSGEKFYGKIGDIEKRLADSGRFIRIHQSYLVNFDHIRHMDFTEALMSDGRKLPISGDRRRTVRSRFCAMAEMEDKENGYI